MLLTLTENFVMGSFETRRCGLCPASFVGVDTRRALRLHQSTVHALSSVSVAGWTAEADSTRRALSDYMKTLREIARVQPLNTDDNLHQWSDDMGTCEPLDLSTRDSPTGEDSPPVAPPPSPADSASGGRALDEGNWSDLNLELLDQESYVDLLVNLATSDDGPRLLTGDLFFLIQAGRRLAGHYTPEGFEAYIRQYNSRWPSWMVAEVYWGCHAPVEDLYAGDQVVTAMDHLTLDDPAEEVFCPAGAGED